ncbi:MAG: diguanylate cyclase [Pseudomonadota bacterium]
MPKRALIIDKIATHRIRFAALLEAARYAVETAQDCDALSADLLDFDIVVVGLPDGRPGREISTVAEGLSGTATPLLCLDQKSSPLRRLLALRSGADEILPRNAPDDLVLALVRSLIRQSEAQREAERRRVAAASFGFSERSQAFAPRARIICAGVPEQVADHVPAVLLNETITFTDRAELPNHMSQELPDLLLLGTGGDGSSLLNVLPEVRDQTHLSPVPIMVVYPDEHPTLAVQALALGANETVPESAGLEELQLRIKNTLARKTLNDALRRSDEHSYQLAVTDHLTGLYNRRYAETYLASLQTVGTWARPEFSVLLIDLDHFKSVNDTFGHSAGDRVLKEVAKRLQSNLRACDLIARYGGEEFLIVLPETSCATAALLGERLKCAISAPCVRVSEDECISITASIGVASGSLGAQGFEEKTGTSDAVNSVAFESFEPVFDAADAALYEAKSTGRNRVIVSSSAGL